MTARLSQADIDAIADALAPRVAKLLRANDPPFPTRGLATVAQVVELLKVEREWVYAHKLELGAVRIGDGERGPLRFDAAKVLAYVADHRLKRESDPEPRRGRPRQPPVGDVDLLPIPDYRIERL